MSLRKQEYNPKLDSVMDRRNAKIYDAAYQVKKKRWMNSASDARRQAAHIAKLPVSDCDVQAQGN
jgi:hypothetical protein